MPSVSSSGLTYEYQGCLTPLSERKLYMELCESLSSKAGPFLKKPDSIAMLIAVASPLLSTIDNEIFTPLITDMVPSLEELPLFFSAQELHLHVEHP